MQTSNFWLDRHEAEQCYDSFEHFYNQYVQIPGGKVENPQLYPFQKRFVQQMMESRYLIGTKFRNGGFTTTTLAYVLWLSLFRQDQRIMFLTGSAREAIYYCGMFDRMCERLPKWIQCTNERNLATVRHWAETNSKVSFNKAEASRGIALTHVFIDEAAFIKDMDQHWKAMYPVIATGGKCVAISTPNKTQGWFYETYEDAIHGMNCFKVFHTHVREHPYWTPERLALAKKNMEPYAFNQEIMQGFHVN